MQASLLAWPPHPRWCRQHPVGRLVPSSEGVVWGGRTLALLPGSPSWALGRG